MDFTSKTSATTGANCWHFPNGFACLHADFCEHLETCAVQVLLRNARKQLSTVSSAASKGASAAAGGTSAAVDGGSKAANGEATTAAGAAGAQPGAQLRRDPDLQVYDQVQPCA